MMIKNRNDNLRVICIVLMIIVIVLTGCQPKEANTDSDFVRSETLYVGGGLWSAPINWNPQTPWAVTPGTIGLIYETLFVWNSHTDVIKPWLAESGEWTQDNVFTVKLRRGIQWTDGKELTAKDVKFTFDLSYKIEELPGNPLWDMLENVEFIDNYTLKFHFKDARHHEWLMSLYQTPIIPEHIWSKKEREDIIEGANDNAIGSGPYLHESYDQDKMVYKRNDNWWAMTQMHMTPQPKRIIMLKIYSNNVALGMILKGDLDLSNFYLPGINMLKDQYQGIHTWYNEEPYYVPQNTVYLFMNNQKKPFDDINFRKAIRYAIDIDMIIKTVYQGQVVKSDLLGFLPIETWSEYYDDRIAQNYDYGYNPEKARQALFDAGYRDIDGDNFIEMPDGENFNLSVICPQGWSDWEESLKVVAKNLRDIGLDVDARFPDYGKYWQDLTGEAAEFDMALNNFGSNTNATPWYMFDWLTREDGLTGTAENGNYCRYDNARVRELLDRFNRIPMANQELAKPLVDEMATNILDDVPVVPLWYGPMFYQSSNQHWTNWPGSHNPTAMPDTNAGQWHLGTIEVLCGLQTVSQ